MKWSFLPGSRRSIIGVTGTDRRYSGEVVISRLVYPKKNTSGPAVAIYPWKTGRTDGPARFFKRRVSVSQRPSFIRICKRPARFSGKKALTKIDRIF
jgi:hypothetical protein